MPAPLPRTMDASHLNAVANSPAVRPGLGMGADPLDFTETLSDPMNIAFADERGGFIFHRLERGRYELHTLLSPEVRGADALALCAPVVRELFVASDCTELVTRVPGNLQHADLMARKAGFREVWTLAAGWVGPGDERVSLRHFAMSIDDWMMFDAALVAEGEAFHGLLRQSSDAAGDTSDLHSVEDDVHDRAAGMATLMARAGNHAKAVWAYGRWAATAVYRPINLISNSPPVYDVGNALVAARNGQLEVLQWLGQR